MSSPSHLIFFSRHDRHALRATGLGPGSGEGICRGVSSIMMEQLEAGDFGSGDFDEEMQGFFGSEDSVGAFFAIGLPLACACVSEDMGRHLFK